MSLRTILLVAVALLGATGGAAPAQASEPAAVSGPAAVPTLAAGAFHTCAIRTEGTPACWGANSSGQTTVPAGTGTVTQIAAGGSHTCAIKTNGAPVCWGSGFDGQTTVPAGTGTVTQVTTGDSHTCAIKTDGTPVCWGEGQYGATTVPAGIGTVTAITAGADHTCAIKTDGTPVCWGRDNGGQTAVPAGIGTVTRIDAGLRHTCAIKTDGTPVCWGDNGTGATSVPAGTGTVTAIRASFAFTCAIRTDGTPVCWGHNSNGQASVPAGIGSVTQLETGEFHACAIKTDGTIACWGYGDSGATTVPPGSWTRPVLEVGGFRHACAIRGDGTPICWGANDGAEASVPAGTGTVTQISAGDFHTCAIKTSGMPVCWGSNPQGESSIPAGTGTVTQIAAGYLYTCAIKSDGTPICWGSNSRGQSAVPAGIGTVSQIAVNSFHTCAIKTNGAPVCWGDNPFGQATIPAGTGTVTRITVGADHTCALKTNGTPACWGFNGEGQAAVPAGTGTATQITTGRNHSCALRTDGTPACWGNNASGQTDVPAGVANVTQIAAGADGTCVVHASGIGTCWGGASTRTAGTTFSSIQPSFAGPNPYQYDTVAAASKPRSGYALSAGALPPGLALDAATGRISGTPTTAGSFSFTIDGANGVTAPDTRQFTIHVDLIAPTTSDDVPAGFRASPVIVTLTAADGAGSGVGTTYYETGTSPAVPTTSSAVYDPAGKPVLADGESIRYFSVDAVGNVEASKSSGVAHVDSTVPETAVNAPAAATNQARPSISFSSAAAGATFACTLDGAAVADCASPFVPAAVLADGEHVFTVAAVSRAGTADPTPARAQFVVDTVAPAAPVLTREPPSTSSQRTADFAWTGEAGAAYGCALDNAVPAPCASPRSYADLAIGEHRFAVTQTDAAGNTGPPATRTFSVVAREPDAPPELTDRSLTFTLTRASRRAFPRDPQLQAVVGCRGAPCRLSIRSRIRFRKITSVRLPAVKVDLTGRKRARIAIPIPDDRRDRIAKALESAKQRPALDVYITARGPSGRRADRHFVGKRTLLGKSSRR